jgi:hypothetical protein
MFFKEGWILNCTTSGQGFACKLHIIPCCSGISYVRNEHKKSHTDGAKKHQGSKPKAFALPNDSGKITLMLTRNRI